MSMKSFLTHKQCVNFKNGFCMAYGMIVNPDEPACPNFAPKTTEQSQAIPKTPLVSYTTAVPSLQAAGNSPQFPKRGGGRTNWYGMSGRGSGRGGGGTGRGGGGRGGRGGGMGGHGRGRMGGGFVAGPGGGCICPNCGYTVPHRVGTPCFQQICPKCGSRMTRKN